MTPSAHDRAVMALNPGSLFVVSVTEAIQQAYNDGYTDGQKKMQERIVKKLERLTDLDERLRKRGTSIAGIVVEIRALLIEGAK